ncbi:MAG: FMN-binding protein [Bacteroidota bacterium]
MDKKVRTTVTKTFNLESFELEPFTVDQTTEDATVKEINKCLFSIKNESELVGYIYVGEAPSMKNIFDYAIIFSPELEIINTKVLIYREKHGRQIGMKRWLKQFFGLVPGDTPELGTNVDGITGATISAKSMTNAVRDVLSSVDVLKTSNQI